MPGSLLVGTLREELILDDKATPALGQAERSFGRMNPLVQGLKSSLANLGLGALGAEITRVSTSFNAGMANVASLIPGNAARVKELTGEVQRLRIALGVTGEDATAGLYQAISAWGDSADTMKLLEINAKAAKGGVASLTDAINLTSAVTKAYGDTSKEAVQQTADLALLTVRLGQTTFPELAGSIGRVTPLAKALGVSQQELFAVMATGSGVTGSAAEVATQFRGVLQALMAPTDAMSELMKKLGYENGQAMLKQLGVVGTLQAIKKAADESGEPLQQYISSIEAQTLALALAGPQAADYKKKLEEMGRAAGTTDAAFREQADGVNWLGQKLAQARELFSVFMEKIGFVGPLLTLGATVAQIITTIGIFRMAKLASAAAITTETAALGANTAALVQNAAAQGAASKGAGLLGRLAPLAPILAPVAAGAALDMTLGPQEFNDNTVRNIMNKAGIGETGSAAWTGAFAGSNMKFGSGAAKGFKAAYKAGEIEKTTTENKPQVIATPLSKKEREKDEKEIARLKSQLNEQSQLRAVSLQEEQSRLGMLQSGRAGKVGDMVDQARTAGEMAEQQEKIRYLKEQDALARSYGDKLLQATGEQRDGIESAYRVERERLESNHRLKMEAISQQTDAAIDSAREANKLLEKDSKLQANPSYLNYSTPSAILPYGATTRPVVTPPALPSGASALLAGNRIPSTSQVIVRLDLGVNDDGRLQAFVDGRAARIVTLWADAQAQNDRAGV